jgi:hypothetical protein
MNEKFNSTKLQALNSNNNNHHHQHQSKQSKLAQVVMFLTCMQEVPSSSLGWDPECLG